MVRKPDTLFLQQTGPGCWLGAGTQQDGDIGVPPLQAPLEKAVTADRAPCCNGGGTGTVGTQGGFLAEVSSRQRPGGRIVCKRG